MPNWVYHYVSLAGPPADIAEFRATCLRPQRDDNTNSRQFDFEALVPMPDEIAATLDDRTDLVTQTAIQATGYRDWYDWSLDHWGVKWNASAFRALSSGAGHEEFYFETAWSCPEPIFHALAQRFPTLAGTIFALDEFWNFGFVGSISAGCFSGSETNACHKLGALTDSSMLDRLRRDPSTLPLLTTWHCRSHTVRMLTN
jgi:hypothetical protein